MKSEILNLRISADLKDEMEILCDINNESISDFTRKAIESYIDNSLEPCDSVVEDEDHFFKILALILEISIDDSIDKRLRLFKRLNEMLTFAKESDGIPYFIKQTSKEKVRLIELSETLLVYIHVLLFNLEKENLYFYEFSDFLDNLLKSMRSVGVICLENPE